MAIFPANIYIPNDSKYIKGIDLYNSTSTVPLSIDGYWITNNAYANRVTIWSTWIVAYFRNDNTVKLGSFAFAFMPTIPTEQQIIDATSAQGSYAWQGNLQYTLPISNICFTKGTPITTNQGNIPIEQLKPNINTIRNKQIVGITQTITQDKYLICFEKNALGNNIPSQKTIMSENHCILHNGTLIKAKNFIKMYENIYKIKYDGEVLYNVLMEEPDKMMVNNLICETLHPENYIAKLYKTLQTLNPQEQAEVIEECNKYAVQNKIFTPKKLTK